MVETGESDLAETPPKMLASRIWGSTPAAARLYLIKIAGRRNLPMGKSTSNSGHDPVRVRTSDPPSVRRIVSSDLEPVMEGFQVSTWPSCWRYCESGVPNISRPA